MINLVNKALNALTADTEWLNRYGEYLFDIWNNSRKEFKGFRKPDGLSVYTTVGSRNTRNYYLRFKGQNVGMVMVRRDGIKLTSLIRESKSHNIKNCPLAADKPVNWDSKEAMEFRNFFKTLPNDTRTKSPEHYVENSLLMEFRKKKRIEKALPNIQPVLLHGNFFQMPSPLKASTHDPAYAGSKGGGIDMLARLRTNWDHVRLCVIEIKDENNDEESQKHAMAQAISYATFIALLLKEQPDWMEFFSGHKSKQGRIQNTIDKHDIEVITIMPTGNTETFENKEIAIPGTQFKLHCHSLYYNKDKFDESGRFDFSGTLLEEIKK